MVSKTQIVERFEFWGPLRDPVNRIVKHIGLTKPSLSCLIVASTSTAYVAQKSAFELRVLEVIVPLFLLSWGGATLNNYQDRNLDAQLRRTRERVLVLGEVGSLGALIQAGLLILAGTLGLLWTTASILLPVTGLTAICLYNLVYTPLKRKTTAAVVPGAVCGVLPVLMGWVAAGGGLDSPRLWLLMVVFGVWQLPHFWLVVLANQQDYRESSIPNMLRVVSVEQLQKLVFVWVTAFAVLTLFLPLYQVILSETATWILLANALILASVFGAIMFSFRSHHDGYRGLFRHLNLSVAVVMSVIIVDSISHSWQ